MEDRLRQEPLTEELLRQAKRMGFADEVIAAYGGTTWQEIRAQRKAWHILPTYKMVDTCAAEFEAATPYYYSTYASEDEVAVSDRKKSVSSAPAPSASDRAWNSTTARSILSGPSRNWAMRPSSSTTTPKRFRRTSTHRINSTLSP